MNKTIKVLDSRTIDKIAAGEVVEKPASVVKELLENSIDAGATAISIDIKNGGIDYIRISDNGMGISRNEVRTAFLPHATSKLSVIEDLYSLSSLGFRGEALSSIAAVSKTELLTKTGDDPVGCKYVIEGGTETVFEEAGVPEGTTFIIRDLFYNTPARRKFLKSSNTEAGHISALVEEMAMDRPDISFKYSINGTNRLVTMGSGNLKEVIYRIYGKDISEALLKVEASSGSMGLSGYIAKPLIARNSRSMENYFVNSRYIKDDIISKAIEDGYAGFLMQHRFPFTVLKLTLDPGDVDINVHPRKMEVKFSDAPGVYGFIRDAVKEVLSGKEFINDFTFGKDEGIAPPPAAPENAPEPFNFKRETYPDKMQEIIQNKEILPETTSEQGYKPLDMQDNMREEPESIKRQVLQEDTWSPVKDAKPDVLPDDDQCVIQDKTPEVSVIDAAADDAKASQLNFFEEKILSKDAFPDYRIIGQVFDTYWIIEYKDEMLLMDQHAAHEKVNYERFMEKFKNRELTTQNINPPIIITLSGEERSILERYSNRFLEMGFEIENFGGNDFAVRTVPYELYGLSEKNVLTALLDELSGFSDDEDITVIHDRIATMACKASIKGNSALSFEEAEELIKQLLSLKDPYNCPHGRPTIIKMSKYEMEKKFKRVI